MQHHDCVTQANGIYKSKLQVAYIQQYCSGNLSTVQKSLSNPRCSCGEPPPLPAVPHTLPHHEACQHPQECHRHPVQAAGEDDDGERGVVAGVAADVLLDAEPGLGGGRGPGVGGGTGRAEEGEGPGGGGHGEVGGGEAREGVEREERG